MFLSINVTNFIFSLQKSCEDKAEKLLSILEEKAQKAINADIIPEFIQCLQQKYSWLYNKLTEDVTDATHVPINFENGFKKRLSLGNGNEFCFKEEFANLSFRTGAKKVKALLECGGVPCLPTVAVEREELVLF